MPEKEKCWTVIKLLEWSSRFLEERSVENSRLCIELLLCDVLKFDRVQLYLHFDRPLSPEELADFKAMLLRRANREPLQYILGMAAFFSLDFFVDKNVLIPRPETELLVEKVLHIYKDSAREIRLLDIGTGSGNIAISLAKNNPYFHITAIDISAAAIKLAQKNAEFHQVADRIKFCESDVCDPSIFDYLGKPFDIIVSNPPYIANVEKPGLEPEVVNFEPAIALFNDDACHFYKIIAPLARKVGKKGGWLICEIGSELGVIVHDIFSRVPLQEIEILPDLAARERIICARI